MGLVRRSAAKDRSFVSDAQEQSTFRNISRASGMPSGAADGFASCLESSRPILMKKAFVDTVFLYPRGKVYEGPHDHSFARRQDEDMAFKHPEPPNRESVPDFLPGDTRARFHHEMSTGLVEAAAVPFL